MENTLLQFQFKKVLLRGYEVLPQSVGELNFYESIDSPVVLGNISIADWQGFHEFTEIFVGDVIEFIFGTTDREELHVKFTIYATIPGMEPTHTFQPVGYKFCSNWFIEGMGRQVSKVYKEKYIHEIVSDLLIDCGANLGVIEPTMTRLPKFVSPLWTPIKTISHLCSFAMNNEQQGNYVFWTDFVTGKVNFTSLDFLYKGMYGKENNTLMSLPRNQLYDGRILSLTFESEFDIISYLNAGVYKTEVQAFNHDKNQFYKFDKTLIELEGTHLGTSFPLGNKYKDEKFNKIKGNYSFPNKDTLVSDDKEFTNLIDGQARTRYNRLYSEVFRINVMLNANSSRRVGKLIDLEYQSENKAEVTVNKKYSGKYLIKNIRHIISGQTYQQAVSLIGDGFKETNMDVIKW